MLRRASVFLAVALMVVAPAMCESQELSSVWGRTLAGVFSVGVRAAPGNVVNAVGTQDSFTGPDKVKHFFMSAFIEAVGFSALQAAGAGRGASIGAATTLTLGTGLAREIHDRRTKGLFSLGDLTWDALGTAAALLLVSHSQR